MFSFVNPFLLSGLALVSIPIIIYLLHRHQVKEVEWAAMQFLQEIIDEQQKRLRLEDLLLLVLRVLMFVFLVLALARLGFKKGSVPLLGDSGDALVVVDASYSMATKQGPRTRFDAARSKADVIIRALPKGHGVSLAKGSEQSETVLGGNLADHDLVRETVKEMQVTDFAGRPDKLVEYVRDFTKKLPSVDQTVFLVSDFQERDWGNPNEGLKTALTDLCEKHTVVFVPVGDDSDANLLAADLTLLQGAVRAGQRAHFAGVVLNQGSKIAEDVPVELMVDGETIETRTLSIGPGQTAEVLFSHPVIQMGQHRAVLKIGQDSNPADNQRYLSFEAHDRLKVLAVVDQPPAAGIAKPTDFVELCLNPFRDASEDPRALYNFVHIGMQELLAEDLSEYELVLIADVSGTTATEAKQLETYVRAGGGVLFFMGGNVDPTLYNDNLHRKGEGLFPWPLLDAPIKNDDEKEPLLLSIQQADHPVWRHIVNGKKNYMGTVRFYGTLGFKPSESKRAICLAAVPAGDSDAAAIAEFTLGTGKVIVVGSSADLSWNNFAACPTFVAFIQQALKRLRIPRLEDRQYCVGVSVSEQVTWEESQSSCELIDPQSEPRSVSVLKEGNQYLMHLGLLGSAGVHTLRDSGSTDGREFSVNVNPHESMIVSMQTSDLSKIYGPMGIVVDDSSDLSVAFSGIGTASGLSNLCLVLAILFWIGENLLAHRIARRQG
ncbi:MAG: BatA domain-containing protein [Kiritimatiellia bacterium]|jgi:hypothetical protein|nr:BatA domain-containing protein [Kiritimatiellia bacterium]